MLGFLALGKGEMGGEEERRLRFPSAYHVPVTEPGLSEWGLLDPSQQACRVGSIILILRAGSWCSKELPLPRTVECRPVLLVYESHAVALLSGNMMGGEPSVRIWWWGFAHPW